MLVDLIIAQLGHRSVQAQPGMLADGSLMCAVSVTDADAEAVLVEQLAVNPDSVRDGHDRAGVLFDDARKVLATGPLRIAGVELADDPSSFGAINDPGGRIRNRAWPLHQAVDRLQLIRQTTE